MQLTRRFFYMSLAIAALILITSFARVHQPYLVLAGLIPVASMLLALRQNLRWLASVSLVSFAGLAAAGILVHVPLLLMMLAVLTALASWDLLTTLIDHHFAPTKIFQSLHMKALGAALSLALVGGSLGPIIHLKIPFVGMVLLVIFLLTCLWQTFRSVSSTHIHL